MYYMYFYVFLNPAVMGYIINGSRKGPKAWFLLKLKELLGQDSRVLCATSHNGLPTLRYGAGMLPSTATVGHAHPAPVLGSGHSSP